MRRVGLVLCAVLVGCGAPVRPTAPPQERPVAATSQGTPEGHVAPASVATSMPVRDDATEEIAGAPHETDGEGESLLEVEDGVFRRPRSRPETDDAGAEGAR